MGGSTFIRKIILILRNADLGTTVSILFDTIFYNESWICINYGSWTVQQSIWKTKCFILGNIIDRNYSIFIWFISTWSTFYLATATCGRIFHHWYRFLRAHFTSMSCYSIYSVNNLTQGKSNAWTWSGSCPTKHARRKD